MAKPIYVGATNRAILEGSEDVSLWDEEELLRGQKRSSNGKWQGRPPKVVPLRIHEELTRRRLSKAYELLRENLVGAVEVLGQIVQDTDAEHKDRIKAAELIMERVMGKAPARVDVRLNTVLDQAAAAVEVVWDVIDVEGTEG